MAAPDFWLDQERAGKVMQEAAQIREDLEFYRGLAEQLEELEVTLELYEDSGDQELAKDLEKGIADLKRKLQKWEEELLFSGPYDHRNAILSLHAGAGGTEAQDWVEMLFRMYSRWAQEHGYKVEILDYLPGEEAGNKSITALTGSKASPPLFPDARPTAI